VVMLGWVPHQRIHLKRKETFKGEVMTKLRTYSGLIRLDSFEERFDYLKLDGAVAHATFGSHRHLNQAFYTSYEWKTVRNWVISRDNGCDLGVPGYEIHSDLRIHHITPITLDDVIHGAENLFDLENLITTTLRTHNAIHYGDDSLLPKVVIQRTRGDTKLW